MNKKYNNEETKHIPTKKENALAVGITILSIIVFGSIGYAFFSAGVSNTNNEKFSTQTATISLRFADNDNGVSGTLNLGESITKKFTLENTGTKEAYAKINWVDLVNTYLSGSLSYTLEQSTSENGTYTNIGSGNVPTSSTATTTVLKNGILVPVNTTYYYKLVITLNNLENVNQNSDINATFSSYFGLEEGSLSGADTIQNLVAGEPTNTTNVITKTAPSGATCTNTLAYDGTTDNNLRYVGANPCNYVTFNGESPTIEEGWIIANSETGVKGPDDIYENESACQTGYQGYGSPAGWECVENSVATGGWRIIGVMNNVDDGTGNLETRIKIVRNDSLGNYSWDTSASNVNSGYGINDWTQADLKNELNGDYLNTSLNANTNWYNGSSNAQTGVYDYTMGLSAAAQAQIGDAKWHLGGMDYTNADLIPNTMYTLERGTKVWGSTSGQTCNDGYCPRATSWTGKVALIYPSDYGYATAGGTTTNRSTCIGTLSTYWDNSGQTWNNSTYSDCYANDWISYQWALSPISNYSSDALGVGDTGDVDCGNTYNDGPVRPAVYLKSETSISGGNGSASEPFILE